MKISMVYDYVRWEEKSIIEAAKRKNVELQLVNPTDLYFDLNDNGLKSKFGDVVLQRCVSYFRNLHLTALLESKGLKVVNCFNAILTAGNKLFCTLKLMNAGVPMPKTMVSFSTKGSLRALDELGYPAIMKPTIGSWGRLISLVKDSDSAQAICEHREHLSPLYQIYYLQELVKRPPRDIRCFVIGDRAVAAIYRVSTTGDWRTNTARGAKAVNCPITNELEDLCVKAAKAIGDGIFGVDCMESPDGLVVHEVNHTIEFKNTVPATGVDIPGLIIDYLMEVAK
ncbi:MAG: lysine biosynthesis protein LysX [Nitrososphaerales archaeon]|nr:lysine biosynthesis protein LysX [Nitrososphaerales archaeon]